MGKPEERHICSSFFSGFLKLANSLRRKTGLKIHVTMFISFLVLLAWLAQPHLANESALPYEPLWAYVCENGQCFRNETPQDQIPDDPVEASIAVCRMACGNFGSLWPKPQRVSLSDSLIVTHPSLFTFNYDGVTGLEEQSSFLEGAVNIMMTDWRNALGLNLKDSKAETKVLVKFFTQSADLTLNWKTKESYTLKITPTDEHQLVVEINGTTVFGARHGIETLGQLGEVHGPSLILVGGASISDEPSFPYRGVLLDTSRHFLTLKSIMKTLDGMATVKLNVLHWHATDSHSFPIAFSSVPEMTKYGAYSDEKIYTPDDMKMLVNYAKQRGIRIVFELDTPSHSGNGWQWGESQGLGKLAVCVNQMPWRDYCVQPPCGQLNPINVNVFKILKKIYKELQQIFGTNDMFHMGGDEVSFRCWNSSKEITDWMKKFGMNLSFYDFLQVWGNFQGTAQDTWDNIAGHSDTPIILWSSDLTKASVIDKFLDPKRYVIETWVDSTEPLPAILLSKGYKLILATKDAWYFDHGFDGLNQYYNWKKVYDNRLPDLKGVLGGEGALWGELVSDMNLDQKLWPRAAALGERLWSNPKEGSTVAQPRLMQHGQRLIRKGISPAPIAPEWCFNNDGNC